MVQILMATRFTCHVTPIEKMSVNPCRVFIHLVRPRCVSTGNTEEYHLVKYTLHNQKYSVNRKSLLSQRKE